MRTKVGKRRDLRARIPNTQAFNRGTAGWFGKNRGALYESATTEWTQVRLGHPSKNLGPRFKQRTSMQFQLRIWWRWFSFRGKRVCARGLRRERTGHGSIFIPYPQVQKPPGDPGEPTPATRDAPRKTRSFCYRGGDESDTDGPHGSDIGVVPVGWAVWGAFRPSKTKWRRDWDINWARMASIGPIAQFSFSFFLLYFEFIFQTLIFELQTRVVVPSQMLSAQNKLFISMKYYFYLFIFYLYLFSTHLFLHVICFLFIFLSGKLCLNSKFGTNISSLILLLLFIHATSHKLQHDVHYIYIYIFSYLLTYIRCFHVVMIECKTIKETTPHS
jgi:hypothetical protein